MASFHCPYPGHQILMSGIWTVKTGHIPDIVHIPDIAQCLGYSQGGLWGLIRPDAFSSRSTMMGSTLYIFSTFHPIYYPRS